MEILAIKGFPFPSDYFDKMFPKVSNRYLHSLLKKDNISLDTVLDIPLVEGGLKISTFLNMAYFSSSISMIAESNILKRLHDGTSLLDSLTEEAEIAIVSYIIHKITE